MGSNRTMVEPMHLVDVLTMSEIAQPVTLPQSLTLQASICFLLTHTVNLYKKYQTYQKGQIGISVVTYWYLAKSETAASKKAASRSLDFVYGWFAHPVTFGDYPQTRRPSVADRLPEFSKEETKLLKGDFLGVNYYTSSYAEASSLSISAVNQSFFGDIHT